MGHTQNNESHSTFRKMGHNYKMRNIEKNNSPLENKMGQAQISGSHSKNWVTLGSHLEK